MLSELADAARSDAQTLPQTRTFVESLCTGTAPTALRTMVAHVVVNEGGARGDLLEYREDGAMVPAT